MRTMMTRLRGERGTALLETAITLPIVLVVVVGIFEFGRAFQTWQVLTNAAREGARLSVMPNETPGTVETRVRSYMSSGQLSGQAGASVSVNRNATIAVAGGTTSASQVTITYPFTFMVLQPVMRLIQPGTNTGAPLTMTASAVMRNEAP
jgi:Flp pilus assembly protein TadG